MPARVTFYNKEKEQCTRDITELYNQRENTPQDEISNIEFTIDWIFKITKEIDWLLRLQRSDNVVIIDCPESTVKRVLTNYKIKRLEIKRCRIPEIRHDASSEITHLIMQGCGINNTYPMKQLVRLISGSLVIQSREKQPYPIIEELMEGVRPGVMVVLKDTDEDLFKYKRSKEKAALTVYGDVLTCRRTIDIATITCLNIEELHVRDHSGSKEIFQELVPEDSPAVIHVEYDKDSLKYATYGGSRRLTITTEDFDLVVKLLKMFFPTLEKLNDWKEVTQFVDSADLDEVGIVINRDGKQFGSNTISLKKGVLESNNDIQGVENYLARPSVEQVEAIWIRHCAESRSRRFTGHNKKQFFTISCYACDSVSYKDATLQIEWHSGKEQENCIIGFAHSVTVLDLHSSVGIPCLIATLAALSEIATVPTIHACWADSSRLTLDKSEELTLYSCSREDVETILKCKSWVSKILKLTVHHGKNDAQLFTLVFDSLITSNTHLVIDVKDPQRRYVHHSDGENLTTWLYSLKGIETIKNYNFKHITLTHVKQEQYKHILSALQQRFTTGTCLTITDENTNPYADTGKCGLSQDCYKQGCSFDATICLPKDVHIQIVSRQDEYTTDAFLRDVEKLCQSVGALKMQILQIELQSRTRDGHEDRVAFTIKQNTATITEHSTQLSHQILQHLSCTSVCLSYEILHLGIPTGSGSNERYSLFSELENIFKLGRISCLSIYDLSNDMAFEKDIVEMAKLSKKAVTIEAVLKQQETTTLENPRVRFEFETENRIKKLNLTADGLEISCLQRCIEAANTDGVNLKIMRVSKVKKSEFEEHIEMLKDFEFTLTDQYDDASVVWSKQTIRMMNTGEGTADYLGKFTTATCIDISDKQEQLKLDENTVHAIAKFKYIDSLTLKSGDSNKCTFEESKLTLEWSKDAEIEQLLDTLLERCKELEMNNTGYDSYKMDKICAVIGQKKVGLLKTIRMTAAANSLVANLEGSSIEVTKHCGAVTEYFIKHMKRHITRVTIHLSSQSQLQDVKRIMDVCKTLEHLTKLHMLLHDSTFTYSKLQKKITLNNGNLEDILAILVHTETCFGEDITVLEVKKYRRAKKTGVVSFLQQNPFQKVIQNLDLGSEDGKTISLVNRSQLRIEGHTCDTISKLSLIWLKLSAVQIILKESLQEKSTIQNLLEKFANVQTIDITTNDVSQRNFSIQICTENDRREMKLRSITQIKLVFACMEKCKCLRVSTISIQGEQMHAFPCIAHACKLNVSLAFCREKEEIAAFCATSERVFLQNTRIGFYEIDKFPQLITTTEIGAIVKKQNVNFTNISMNAADFLRFLKILTKATERNRLNCELHDIKVDGRGSFKVIKQLPYCFSMTHVNAECAHEGVALLCNIADIAEYHAAQIQPVDLVLKDIKLSYDDLKKIAERHSKWKSVVISMDVIEKESTGKIIISENMCSISETYDYVALNLMKLFNRTTDEFIFDGILLTSKEEAPKFISKIDACSAKNWKTFALKNVCYTENPGYNVLKRLWNYATSTDVKTYSYSSKDAAHDLSICKQKSKRKHSYEVKKTKPSPPRDFCIQVGQRIQLSSRLNCDLFSKVMVQMNSSGLLQFVYKYLGLQMPDLSDATTAVYQQRQANLHSWINTMVSTGQDPVKNIHRYIYDDRPQLSIIHVQQFVHDNQPNLACIAKDSAFQLEFVQQFSSDLWDSFASVVLEDDRPLPENTKNTNYQTTKKIYEEWRLKQEGMLYISDLYSHLKDAAGEGWFSQQDVLDTLMRHNHKTCEYCRGY